MDRKRLFFIALIFGVLSLMAGSFQNVSAFSVFLQEEAAAEESPAEEPAAESAEEQAEVEAPAAPAAEYPKETETGRQVGFYWTPSEGAESYEVKWKNDSGTESSLELDAGDATCQEGRCIAFDEVPGDGTYTWTVTAVNAGGSAASEEAEFFVRASLPAPDAYRPNTPLNSQKQLVFEWEDIRNNASDYRIQVMDRTTDRILMDQWYPVSGMYVGNGLCYMESAYYLPTGVYAWRVKGRNASAESDWSAWVDFQTTCPDCQTGVYVNTNTSAVYPLGETVDLSPKFEWLAVTGAAYYMLQVNAPDGSTIADVSVNPTFCGLEACSFDSGLSLEPGSTYDWSVSTYGGNNGRWGTDAVSLTVVQEAAVNDIAFVGPEDGGKPDEENPQIIWTDPGSSAASFRLVILDAAGNALFFSDVAREDAWCDGKTCSIVFRSIPEGEGYRIFITPYSETNAAGSTISLTFSR